jgi:hypothetical protein
MAKTGYYPEFYHREVEFCKVYGRKSKDVIESILLKNRISYFIDMPRESLLRRIFWGKKGKDRTTFVFSINEADVESASELLKNFDRADYTKIESESGISALE